MFEELVEAVINLLGCGMFILVFALGGFLTNLIKSPLDTLSSKYNLGYNRTVVSLICKGIVVAISFLYCMSQMPAFTEVLDSMMPFGDYEDIMAEVAMKEDKWLFNVLFNVFIVQFAITTAYFIPYILVDLVISLCLKFLCSGEETSFWKTAVGWVTDILVVYAVNALVLRSGLLFPELTLRLLEKFDFSSGIVSLILMLVPTLLLLFAVMRDLITSDILISTLGISITVSMMDITLHDGNRWYIFAVAYGCSFIAKIIRSRISDEEETFKGEAFAALLTFIGTALVSWGLFSL